MNTTTLSPEKTKKDVSSKSMIAKQGNQRLRKLLLACGVLSSLWYAVMNTVAPIMYEGYSVFSQTVSELSAIGSPTKSLWASLGIFYSIFLTAFGLGVWMSAGQSRALKLVGIATIISAITGIFWPPMHQREIIAAGGGTTSDVLHIVFTAVLVPLTMVIIGFGATVFGKKFRLYSILTIIVMLGFGILTGLASPDMEANLPTPWLGIWERILIGAQMLWIAIFASLLLKRKYPQVTSVKLKS